MILPRKSTSRTIWEDYDSQSDSSDIISNQRVLTPPSTLMIENDVLVVSEEESEPETQDGILPIETRWIELSESEAESVEEDYGESSKRRKITGQSNFVGGYDDADSNFIQPEDDAMDLPDDVAQETGFVSASTIKGLLVQLKEQQDKFDTNYEQVHQRFLRVQSEFHQEKKTHTTQNNSDQYRTHLLRIDAQYDELDAWHRRDLVRFGIDVLDLLVRKLDKKLDRKGRTMDEGIDFKLTAQKELENRLAENLRQLAIALANECDRMGVKKEIIELTTADLSSGDPAPHHRKRPVIKDLLLLVNA